MPAPLEGEAASVRFPPEPLDREELERLVSACGRSPSGVRNRALILTLYWTGLRVSEALALKSRDLDETRVRVRHGKGNASRVVNLPLEARLALDVWLPVRSSYADDRDPVFCLITKGREGGAIGDAYVRQMLPRLAARAGIRKRVHAHGLRHSCALRIARAGGNMLLVQTQLGHASAATTAKYLRMLGADGVLEQLHELDQ